MIVTQVRDVTHIPTTTNIVQCALNSAQFSNKSKINQNLKIGKEESKVYLDINDSMIYVGNQRESAEKLLKLIRKHKQNFWLCIRYMQSRVSLYTSNEP